MPTKKLIINADDFGLTKGTSAGIISAFIHGIVSSTTALVVVDTFDESVALANKIVPDLPIGLHLALTLRGAKPILPPEEVPSLVDSYGNFWTQHDVFEKARPEDVYREWDAQITRFIQSGQRPDHLDSHHNVHGRDIEILKVAVALASKYRLPLRNASRIPETEYFLNYYESVPTTDKIMPQFYGEDANIQTLTEIFDQISIDERSVLFEINCHPAFLDQELKDCSGYYDQRRVEHAILTADETAQKLADHNIMLTNYELLS